MASGGRAWAAAACVGMACLLWTASASGGVRDGVLGAWGDPVSAGVPAGVPHGMGPVPVYVAYKDGCPYCEEEMEGLREMAAGGMGHMLRVVPVRAGEVGGEPDPEGAAALSEVASMAGLPERVPVTVVGGRVFQGWDDEVRDAVMRAVAEEYAGSRTPDAATPPSLARYARGR